MKNEKPNIILINCDDLGYGDLGCYGSKLNETPNLDRLACEGLQCTNFYMASSICSPSRAALMTGCYPQRISMNRVLFPGDSDGLGTTEETLPAALKKVGYNTAIVGKWHLGDQKEFLPTRYGFDQYYGIPFSNDMGRQTGDPEDKAPLPIMDNEEIISQQPDQSGITERYVEESLRFIRKNQDNPFFLYLAHMYVHLPLYVPEKFLKRSKNGRYGAALACVDWAMGVLEQELKRLDLYDDTIVIFTSDNGSRANNEGGSNGKLRGTKFTTWEGGFRVPMIIRWPNKIKTGKTDEIISSIDLLPTLLDFANTSPNGKHKIDGLNFSQFLKEGKNSPRDTFIYFSSGNLAAIRKGKWKLHFCIRTSWGKPFDTLCELYNLEEDEAESHNVINQNPKIADELRKLADDYRKTLGDAHTNNIGQEVRDCSHRENPVTLTTYDKNYPYLIAEYDLADRG
jgi:arylsulfatase A-like enzyme